MVKDKREGWIRELKVGDFVFYNSSSWYRTIYKGKITKITSTGRIKVGGFEFDPKGRSRGGDSWHFSSLIEPTKNVIETWERQELINYIQNWCQKGLPEADLKLLRKIYGFIKKK